jgi:D-alanyl-D-alanine dipeptidase
MKMNTLLAEIKNYLNYTSILIFLLLITSSCATKPPYEKGDFKDSDLVELVKLDSSFHLDIRYATNNNLVGRPVYTEAKAFLQRPAAEALIKVNAKLKPLGYGLLIFDGYRPWSVTKLFWDITPAENKIFVANPKDGSRHNRGCAIDLSLYDLKTGKEVLMTSEYDEMNESSYPNFKGGTAEQRKTRDLLINEMEANGFKVYEYEWWHFDFQGWETYRIQNIQFSEIR